MSKLLSILVLSFLILPSGSVATTILKCDATIYKEPFAPFKPDLDDVCDSERNVCKRQKTLFWLFRGEYFESTSLDGNFIACEGATLEPSEKGNVMACDENGNSLNINTITGEYFYFSAGIYKKKGEQPYIETHRGYCDKFLPINLFSK